MSFSSVVRNVDPAQRAIVTANDSITFEELLCRSDELRAAVTGLRLMINTADVSAAVEQLLAADGGAQAIALISPSLDMETVRRLTEIVSVDAILSNTGQDQRAGVRQLSGTPSVREPVAGTLDARRTSSDDARGTEWILTTSGTSGMPKLVSHSFGSLTRTSRYGGEKGRGQVWGLLYDYTRFAGLQVVLQSVLSGACLAVPPADKKLEAQLDFLARSGCTHLSATPTMWRKILMTPSGASLRLKQVTLGGEIADSAVLNSLARTYPDARISHIFASTEAGVGFSVTDGKAGFPAGYLQKPPAGGELKIEAGRLWIRSNETVSVYLDVNAELIRDGWVDTGDAVELVGDRVYFRGRENGVINVGGNKVHPEQVEQALLAHPHVLMARVYSRRNPITGSLVVADVALTRNAPDDVRKDLFSHLKARLERYMIPADIRIVESLDTNAAGKIGRKN